MQLPAEIETFVLQSTESFGKAKLVLRESVYRVESRDPGLLQRLLREPVVAEAARLGGAGAGMQQSAELAELSDNNNFDDLVTQELLPSADADADADTGGRDDDDDDDDDNDTAGARTGKGAQPLMVNSFELKSHLVARVKERCIAVSYSL